MTRTSLAILALLAMTSAGCGSSDTPTSPDTTALAPSTELFAGTLDVAGESFFSFTVTETGTVRVTLGSLTGQTGAAALTTSVGLGLGTPAGTGCAMTNSMTVDPGLTAQVTQTLEPGIHCANVFDVGNLKASANFAIRIVHP